MTHPQLTFSAYYFLLTSERFERLWGDRQVRVMVCNVSEAFRPLAVQDRQDIAHVCNILTMLDLQLPAGPPSPSKVSEEA